MSDTTEASTIMALIGELIETHMGKCDDEFPPESPDHIAHVISPEHGTRADIGMIENLPGNNLILTLTDGSRFTINVAKG